MAYNLPPPWDPGFAMPENALDEGLERRGFVTKQMPRGTYDAVRTGTGGYAVPAYVLKEGTGQGAYGTKMMPRGTRPNVPNYLDRRPQVVSQRSLPSGGNAVTMALSGDAPLPALYENFGARSASSIMARIAGLPSADRKPTLKKILDAIDPTLWKRTAEIANRYAAKGMPAGQALAHGLARAMSTGIAAEIVATGQRRSAPQPRSLLGLGCYGREALGAAGGRTGTAPALTLVQAVVSAFQPSLVTCAGYSYVAAANGVPAHWERAKAGQAPNPGPAGTGCPGPEVRVQGGVTVTGGGTTTETKPVTVAPELQSRGAFKMGPFLFPIPGGAIREIRNHRTPTAEQKAFIADAIKDASTRIVSGNILEIAKGKYPLVKSQWPTRDGDPNSGKWYGLYYAPQPDGSANVTLKEYVPGTSVFQAIWNGIKAVAGAIVDVVKDAIDAIGDLACSVANSAAGPAAGAVAGAVIGGPGGAQAGVAGAGLAKAACYEPPPSAPLVSPPADGGSLVLPVAIAGGVALAAFMFTRKKKP